MFELFLRLLELERSRRPETVAVTAVLEAGGFVDVATMPLVETRRTYQSLEELRADLHVRTGRSILHALDDAELERLIDRIGRRVGGAFPLTEQDYWTVWSARTPADLGDHG